MPDGGHVGAVELGAEGERPLIVAQLGAQSLGDRCCGRGAEVAGGEAPGGGGGRRLSVGGSRWTDT